jgi:hypothetical protein
MQRRLRGPDRGRPVIGLEGYELGDGRGGVKVGRGIKPQGPLTTGMVRPVRSRRFESVSRRTATVLNDSFTVMPCHIFLSGTNLSCNCRGTRCAI